MRLISGKYIQINEFNLYLADITEMLLEHFDTLENDNSVIILGTYVRRGLNVAYFRELYPGKKIIIYQLEAMMDNDLPWHAPNIVFNNIRGADEIWDYDLLNIKYLSWKNIKVDKFVPIRATRAIDRNWEETEEDIDVLFYGFLNERRADILNKLQQRLYGNVSIVTLSNVGLLQLDHFIRRSKIILNLHAFEPYNRQEQVRMLYPVMNGKYVLSEPSQANYFGESICEVHQDKLHIQINHALKDGFYKKKAKKAKGLFIKTTLHEVDYQQHKNRMEKKWPI